MTIQVRGSHIRKGSQWITQNSPIVLALRDAGLKSAIMDYDNKTKPTSYFFTIKGQKKPIRLPKEVNEWIFEFNKYHKGKPFEFEVEDQ